MAWAPGWAGLSLSARSAGEMGSQSSPAWLDGRVQTASSTDKTVIHKRNRWARFKAILLDVNTQKASFVRLPLTFSRSDTQAVNYRQEYPDPPLLSMQP